MERGEATSARGGFAPGGASRRSGPLRLSPYRSREEGGVGLLGKARAEKRVDHRVEGDVVGGGDAGKEPGVAEENVVELVHHEHEEVGVGAAVLLDEPGVDAEDGPAFAGDAGGGHVLGDLDAEELEEGAEGVAPGGTTSSTRAHEGVGFG